MSASDVQYDDPWSAINLELIVFPLGPTPSAEQEWWNDLTGSDCESVRRRHERIDKGDFHGCALRLVCDLSRISWAIGAHIRPDENIDSPPLVGPFGQAIEWFSPLMERWLSESCPPVKRIAFVGKLAQSDTQPAMPTAPP
jgi:hypothetical protein